MMFRLTRTMMLALALVGCSGNGDGKAGSLPAAPPSLSTILEEALRHCGDDGASTEACKRATHAPSWLAPKNIKVPAGFLSVMVTESCQSQNFAELEAVALLSSGATYVRAGFLRRDDGKWFLGRIAMVEESMPKLCEDIPQVYGVEEAKKQLKGAQSDWVVWSREDGKDVADFQSLWRYQCEIDAVMFGGSPDGDFKRVEVGCWLSDGFPALLEDASSPLIEGNLPYLYMRLVFADGTQTDVVKVENPNHEGR